MPAASSSPIDPAIGQLLAAVQSLGPGARSAAAGAGRGPRSRARRGVRHRLAAILAWRCARCWPGPGPSRRSPNGPSTRTRPPGKRSGFTGMVPPVSSLSGGPCSPWTPMRWMTRRAAGPSSAPFRQRTPSGRSPWTARYCADPASPPAGPASAGRAGSRARRGPGPSRCRGQDERDSGVRHRALLGSTAARHERITRKCLGLMRGG
jgi:hypothetical protein